MVKKTSSFRYAVGMFGTSIPINMFKTYAAIYYVDKLGLTMKSFSFVLLMYTFIDAIDNPIYGFLSDRTRSKWGRRRPWLIVGTPILVLGFILFFNVPSFIDEGLLIGYFLLMYILTGTLDSLINANYGALFPELFKGDEERATTNAIRKGFELVAMVISIALTPVITDSLGFSNTALLYGLVGGLVILYCAFGCHERDDVLETEKPRLLNSLKCIASNKKFWISGVANAFYSAAMSLVLAAIPFYAKYTLGISSGQTTILFASVLLIAMGGVVVWSRLIKKYGSVKIWRVALMALCLAFIPLYLANTFTFAIFAASFIGFGFSGVITSMDLIGAKIMDEDSRKYGVQREGIYSSASGFMNRLNGVFTSFAFYLVFVLYGFESGNNPGNIPGDAAKFLVALFPFVIMVFSCVTSLMLKFEEDEKIVDKYNSEISIN